jgi:hypothetical protein
MISRARVVGPAAKRRPFPKLGDFMCKGAHAARRVLKRQTSQVRNTKTVGHAQPKSMAIESVSPLTCDGSLVLLPWEAKAQATFNAQPVATAIAAAARPFKRERDLTSQKSTTGSRRAVSSRAVVAKFFMMSPNERELSEPSDAFAPVMG